jgi:hypothetical protein
MCLSPATVVGRYKFLLVDRELHKLTALRKKLYKSEDVVINGAFKGIRL